MTKRRFTFAFFVLAAIIGMTVAPAFARTESITHGGEFYGTSVVVGPGQDIDGSIDVYGGDVTVDGGTVHGDVNTYGGSINTENGGQIFGHTREYGESWGQWLPFGPSATIAHENARLMTRLAYSVIVVLAFLIFPIRVRKAMDRVEHHPGLSAAAGVVALIAVIPLAILLALTIVGIPLIFVEFVAIFAGILIGQAALGILLGRRIFELVRPHGTPTPLAALIIGLVVLSAAEILPAIGGLVTALVCLVGLGAAILAFIRETTFLTPGMPAGAAAGPQGGPRPPIGGPPMKQV
ncbi:MAG TPA: hypothetical protein VFL13_14260 [Candidatus Baltobacteraceae bacterium]|nr:hypothetical protein [Candidatus Baltobacteraceae bacterium]